MDSQRHNETSAMQTLQPYIISLLQSRDLSVSLERGVTNAIEGELKSFLVSVSHNLHRYMVKNERSCVKIVDIIAVLKGMFSDTYIYEKNKNVTPTRTYLPLCVSKNIIIEMHPSIKMTKQCVEYLRFVSETYLCQLFDFMLPSLDKTLGMEAMKQAVDKMSLLTIEVN